MVAALWRCVGRKGTTAREEWTQFHYISVRVNFQQTTVESAGIRVKIFQNGSRDLLRHNIVVAFIGHSVDGISIHPAKSRESSVAMTAAGNSACLNAVSCDLGRVDFGPNGLEVEIFQL